MPEIDLYGLRVAVLATDGVEESELASPIKALRDARATVEVIAPHGGRIQAFKHHDKSTMINVDRTLSDAGARDYDALVLPGGALNADALRVDRDAQNFAREMDEANKPIAVICHGPWLLVSAGLIRNRRLTSYHTIQDDIRNAGGSWIDQKAVVDRNWVSSRSPADLAAFNAEFLSLLSSSASEKAA